MHYNVYGQNTINSKKGRAKLEAIIYFFIFIIGTLFGSFFTLAVYRLPIKQSITHGRSYCPKCNHRLEFLDLIPVLSYIFLGGKCRYCKEKIRPRYIALEILSGIVFLLFALSLRINLYNLEISKIVYLVFGMLYLSTLFIIGGIEKEKHYVSKSVLLFGLIVETIYIIYLYIVGINIYKYVIYLFLLLLFILINTIFLKKKGKENYTIQILMLCFYFAMFAREEIVILSIILTILMIIIKQISISKKENKEKTVENTSDKLIPIGFYLCVCNIATLIIQNYII